MQDCISYAPSLVIVACGNTVEVTMGRRVVRFLDASPALVETAKRSAAFPPLRDYLRYLTISGAWPTDVSELTLPAIILEGVFCGARVLEVA
ncbi:hypothetical protein [Sabulicella rubraurantiaca]|uniref:hypothetical protein n=1 Tax=Sabulicella rubraurantiaca TaxID=2811429 RepID=UPI001A961B41|nr:hypothetical protein [Sabulicella rubraurantiaca]